MAGGGWDGATRDGRDGRRRRRRKNSGENDGGGGQKADGGARRRLHSTKLDGGGGMKNGAGHGRAFSRIALYLNLALDSACWQQPRQQTGRKEKMRRKEIRRLAGKEETWKTDRPVELDLCGKERRKADMGEKGWVGCVCGWVDLVKISLSQLSLSPPSTTLPSFSLPTIACLPCLLYYHLPHPTMPHHHPCHPSAPFPFPMPVPMHTPCPSPSYPDQSDRRS